jgi:hypothetical protein
VVVDEVRVRGVGFEGLVGVADAAGHEDRLRRVELGRVHGAERGPSRRSTQAPKMRPVATDTHLSHGSAWMPRVVPTASLKEMLFCTGPKSGRPSAVIFSRCQFSLNQPRASPCTGRSKTTSPGSASR